MNVELPNSERVHHPYSPSTLQPREACAKYAPQHGTTNEAAEMGTLQHDMAETGDENHRIPDYRAMAAVECMKFVDERFALYPGGTLLKEQYLPIDDEIVYLRPRATCKHENWDEAKADETVDADFCVDCGKNAHQIELAETPIAFQGTTAGYVDVAILSADGLSCEVIDYKFGRWGVEKAGNNLQGIAYLIGLKKAHPKLKKGTVWFVLPHRDEISGAEFSLEDGPFAKLYLRVKTVVHRAIEANTRPDDFSMANPTTACMFCDLLGKCPKVAELALNIGKKYRPLEIPDSVSTTVFTNPADVSKGLLMSGIIKRWAEAFKTQASAKVIDAPNFIPPGFDIVEMSKRSIEDPRKLADLAKTYLPPEDAAKVEALFEISLGPLEKLISTAAVRGSKEKTVNEFGEKAAAAGYVKQGQPFAFLRMSTKEK